MQSSPATLPALLPDQEREKLNAEMLLNKAAYGACLPCKLNEVNPVAYLAETLDAIINGYPQSRIEELMPWRFRKTSSPNP
uniref:transposase domain-containing protein n=1 Tax=Xanthobacter dioxanivorans TaxID=2528964 RepID=UPI001E3D7F88|nr:transposase domain-containing protein [Xanthobacter dioxanivorans]